jgi:hypothetical protein
MTHRSPSRGLSRAPLLALVLLAACAPVAVGPPPAGYGTGGGYGSGGAYPPPSPPPPPREELERRPLPQGALLRSSPPLLNFGALEVGDAADRQLSLVNGGDETAEVLGVGVEGLGFRLMADACSGRRLGPGGSCTVRVRFAPEERGQSDGVAVFVVADPGRRRFEVVARGEGLRPRAEQDVQVDRSRVDFGAIEVGQSASEDVRVSNRGTRELRVREVRAFGPGFAVRADACTGRTLAPGAACVVAVRFAPPSPGDAAGRLEVASDDPDERVVAVELAGRARKGQRCAQVRLKMRWDRDPGPEPLVVSGVLPRGECLGYALEVKRDGRLLVCVPPGYTLSGKGVELLEGKECRIGDDPVLYRTYRRPGIEGGSDLTDLTLTRRDGARQEFKLRFEFRGRRDAGEPGRDDD